MASNRRQIWLANESIRCLGNWTFESPQKNYDRVTHHHTLTNSAMKFVLWVKVSLIGIGQIFVELLGTISRNIVPAGLLSLNPLTTYVSVLCGLGLKPHRNALRFSKTAAQRRPYERKLLTVNRTTNHRISAWAAAQRKPHFEDRSNHSF